MLKSDPQTGVAAAAVSRVLTEEAQAILSFAEQSAVCADAAQLIYETTGPLIVAGIGKSGHVAHKIAATFRSLGKPAVFMHAAEASHGDLGLIQPGSAVLVLSNSGETTELSDTLHYCRDANVPVIGVTGRAESALAHASRVAIVYGPVQEACRNKLAPTTSTTLTLAIGDALAVAVSEMMGTAPEDFRRYHPGGRLGARLLTVADVMRVGADLPLVTPDTPMRDVVVTISQKSLGVAVVVDGDMIRGIITDGDLRRHADGLLTQLAGDVATPDPVRIQRAMSVMDATELMSQKQISACLVDDGDGRLVGLVHIHDCLRSGAID